MARSRLTNCTLALLAISLLLASSCAARPRSAPPNPSRDVAHALLVKLFETYPPKGRIACVTIYLGPEGTWQRLETSPTLRYLKARGIDALDGSSCVQIPPPPDATGGWTSVGEIIHSQTGRPAATYGVRVVQVGDAYARLHGGFAFSRRHGGSCPYEARLVDNVWIVREQTDEPCSVM